MNREERDRLQRLAALAALIRDRRQAELAHHAAACARTRGLLADLSAPLPRDSDLPLPALETAALQHAIWVRPQRIRLNERLALQTAARLVAEDGLRNAFGRALALARLAERQKP